MTNTPSRGELEAILKSISEINVKIKALDREVGLSKAYVAKFLVKPGNDRLSPVEGESDMRWKLRETERPKRANRSGKSNVANDNGTRNVQFDDKMED